MPLVSVNRKRGGESVAWRAWIASPKLYAGSNEWFLDEAAQFMLENSLLAIGHADEFLGEHPATWPKFKAKTGYAPVVFYFANRMKKSDLVVLAKNAGHILAYGYLKDDELRFIGREHPLAAPLSKLQDKSRKIYEAAGMAHRFESYTNYRLVDHWIKFDGSPRNVGKAIDGSIIPTIFAVPVQRALSWLGLTPNAARPPHDSVSIGGQDGEE